MITSFLTNIKVGWAIFGIAFGSWLGVQQSNLEPLPEQNSIVKGTFQTPDVRALFIDSLASKITSSATSMTLSSGLDGDGNSLASSTYGFILDEGTSVEEFVLADCTGTVCTNMSRGISTRTGTSTVSALQFEHRRGASVKITTSPSVLYAINALKGRQNIENVLHYNSAQTFNNAHDIIDRDYADQLSFGAIPASSETAAGFVELATGLEAASTTSSGSTARLVLPASIATSTYNSATANLKVVMTQNNGKIDPSFVSTTTLFVNSNLTGTTTLATTTIIGSFPAYQIGKNIAVITSTQSFTIPSGVKMLKVELVGGGGGTCGGNNDVIAGAGGGGYALKYVDVSATSSVYVTIGAGGSGGSAGSCITHLGTTGGTTSFGTFFSATGGNANSDWNVAGSGGTGSGGDFNSYGQSGTLGNGVTGGSSKGGSGGGSTYGGGGIPGSSGNAYGGGGGGITTAGSAGGTGGASGVAIITW